MTKTMTSFDFLNDIVNPVRLRHEECKVKNVNFIVRVMDELELDESKLKVLYSSTGSLTHYVDLNWEQMILVGMLESKSVRREVLARLHELDD